MNKAIGFWLLGVDIVYAYQKWIANALGFRPLGSTLYILAFSSLDIVYTYQKMNTVSGFNVLVLVMPTLNNWCLRLGPKCLEFCPLIELL